jgi:2'-5' RNA ligase
MAAAPTLLPPPSSSYSLWFAPAAGSSVRAVLEREIATQAAKHGSDTFEPHVTLLGDLRCAAGDAPARSAAELFARRTKPFRVSLLGVATGPTFHQCVFLQCANEGALSAAHARMRAICAEQGVPLGEAGAATDAPPPPAAYAPHLSLLYSGVGEAERAAAAAEATARLYGPESDYGTLLADDGFDARTVSLWHTPLDSGGAAAWRLVAELPLEGQEG